MNTSTRQALIDRSIQVPAGDASIEGQLIVPPGADGTVLFAHGSGSSRFSPRNRHVASVIQQGCIGTLLIDLLTEEEERIDQVTRHIRFDIGHLARRLVAVTDWLTLEEDTGELAIGYFGASTGAAAALMAAVERPESVKAVVSRGGRPDLAGEALTRVRTPTLLIVGGNDVGVIELNQVAHDRMAHHARIEIIPGATHLFEEPGTLDRAAELARDWFHRHLGGAAVAS